MSFFRRMRSSKPLRYAFDILVGTALLQWLLMPWVAETPVWAIVSFALVTDPDAKVSGPVFLWRIIYTLIGCIVALLALRFLQIGVWLIPISLAVSVLISGAALGFQNNWRLSMVTTVVVIGSAMAHRSPHFGLEDAARREGEVFAGSLFAVVFSWLISIFVAVWAGATEYRDGLKEVAFFADMPLIFQRCCFP